MKNTSSQLVTYLNDHLAGSVSLINLLDHLKRTKAGKKLKHFLEELKAEVCADRKSLEALMRRARVSQHAHRKASAWLVEKLSHLKLRADDSDDGALHVLEALEFVEVGLEGKRALWRPLAPAGEQTPIFPGTNFELLIQRARDQHDRVEAVRVQVAKAALVPA